MAYIKELRVTYKRKRVKDDLLKKQVTAPKQVYELFKYMQDETKEKVVCLHLNPQKEILSYEVVAIGTANKVLINAKEIYVNALLARADGIIIVHNHTSSSSKPSPNDIKAVKKLVEMGEVTDTPLIDFIIIGGDGFFSFDEKKVEG